MHQTHTAVKLCTILILTACAPNTSNIYTHKQHGTVSTNHPVFIASHQHCDQKIYGPGITLGQRNVHQREQAIQFYNQQLEQGITVESTPSTAVITTESGTAVTQTFHDRPTIIEPAFSNVFHATEERFHACLKTQGWQAEK